MIALKGKIELTADTLMAFSPKVDESKRCIGLYIGNQPEGEGPLEPGGVSFELAEPLTEEEFNGLKDLMEAK